MNNSDPSTSSSTIVGQSNEPLTQGQKALQKLKENPFIPIGFIATCTALGIAFRKMQARDSVGYQRWLRARVVAQGLTIVAIVAAGIKEWDKFKHISKSGESQKRQPRVGVDDGKGFDERMKAAEEAHKAEMALSGTARGEGVDVKEGARMVAKGAADKANATREEAQEKKPQSSGWSSWFGVFTKGKPT